MKSNKKIKPKNQTKKIKTNKKECNEGDPHPFFTHPYKQPGPNNLLQIYKNAKNIKNRRTI